jgi:hypothetical protein
MAQQTLNANTAQPLGGPNTGLGTEFGDSIATLCSKLNAMMTELYAAAGLTLPGIFAGGLKSSSPDAGVGYATGAGGTVTQATDKSTGVTLNKATGQITMNNAALAAGAEVSFTLTNSVIAATDIIVVNIASGGTAGAYGLSVTAVANGSCQITVTNLSGGSLSEALVLNFAVIKGVAA